jgi:UDP-glucose 4,6-dehydratase
MRNLDALKGRPNFKFIRGDIQSGDLLSYVLATEGIDTVMHFAAQTHVDNSFGNSLAFTLTNVYGTHVLLEACRAAGPGVIRRILNVSTDEVYGEGSVGCAVGLGEGATLEPTNPYSAAKAGAEMMARAYATSYRLPVLTTRGNNVYGPGQFPEKLVPKFTLLAARGAPLPVHGDGGATRSYLFIDDVAAAYDVILHKGVDGEVYNIGTQKERTVLDVARDIAAIFAEGGGFVAAGGGGGGGDGGGDAPPGAPARHTPAITHVRDRAFNDRRYFICDAKLAALGWAETIPWSEGLRRTVAWYAAHGLRGHWDEADVEAALAPHPVLHSHSHVGGGGGGGWPGGPGSRAPSRAGSGLFAGGGGE